MDEKPFEKCVCMDWAGACVAIERNLLRKGHDCEHCPFYKTEEEYIRQMGHSYEEEMREVRKYHGSNN